jgi:hypothetical protein
MSSGQVRPPEEVEMDTKEYLKTAAKRAFERIITGEDANLDLAARFFPEELDATEPAGEAQDLPVLARKMITAIEASDDNVSDDTWRHISASNVEMVRESRARNVDFYREHLMPILVDTLSSMPESERDEILSEESDRQMEELLKRSRRAQLAMFGV